MAEKLCSSAAQDCRQCAGLAAPPVPDSARRPLEQCSAAPVACPPRLPTSHPAQPLQVASYSCTHRANLVSAFIIPGTFWLRCQKTAAAGWACEFGFQVGV